MNPTQTDTSRFPKELQSFAVNPDYVVMHDLHARCLRIRQAIVTVSDVQEDVLRDASTELEADYEVWCSDYKGPDLADSVEGFGEMLREWHSPWPYIEESSLNGLTIAQFYFSWAYGEINDGIDILATRPLRARTTESGACFFGSVDDAAVSAINAVKALMHAKHLLTSSENGLAQATHQPSQNSLPKGNAARKRTQSMAPKKAFSE